MRYHQSNQKYELPHTELVIPRTLSEFKDMIYTQRLLFRQKDPRLYQKFQDKCDRERLGLMPWE